MGKIVKKHRRQEKNSSYKRFSWVFLSLAILTLIIFQISFASGFTFDNVKDYNPETKTLLVDNGFGLGDYVAELKLNTPQNYGVGVGYVKVAEFDLEYYKDDNGGLDLVEFYDLKRKSIKIERQIDYKIKVYKNITIEEYGKECLNPEYDEDVLIKCDRKVTGTHLKEVYEWRNLNYSELIKGKRYTIGLFTNTKEGEHVEWIPTFYGVEISEWAEWTAGLNTNLVAYYPLNNTVDVVGGHDGTNQSSPTYVAGLIGNALNNDGWVDIADHNDFDFSGAFSISIWSKTTATNAVAWVGKDNDEDTGEWNFWGDKDTGVYFSIDETHLAIATNKTGWDNDAFHHFVVTRDGSDIFQIWVDGALGNETTITTDLSSTPNVVLGANDEAGNFNDRNDVDEAGFWSRALTQAEIVQLYNSGSGITYLNISIGSSPTVTLNSPANDTNYTATNDLTFNCTASDDINLTNVSLYIDGTLNQTNSTGVNNSDYIFTINNIADGDYTWNCDAWDNSSQQTNGTTRDFNVDTTPFIEFITPTTANNTNQTLNYLPFNVNLTETFFNNLTVYLYTSSGLNASDVLTNTTRSGNFTGLNDDTYYLNATVWTNTSQSNSTGTREYTIDSTPPSIAIVYPINATTYNDGLVTSTTKNISLNWTTTDDNLDTCWYYNTTANVTVTCGNNATINLTYGTYTLKVYANDTFGLETEEEVTATWEYDLLQNSVSYSTSALMGSTQSFSINVSYNQTEFTNSLAYLYYNGTQYSATRTGSSGVYNFSKAISIPIVAAATNVTFYWNVILNNGTNNYYNSSSYTQTINPLNAGNCSIYNETLYNFTMVDEDTQATLNATAQNSTANLNLQIYDSTRTTMIQNYSASYNQTNPFAVCLNNNISGNYIIDLELDFDSGDYAHEFYNIQRENLTVDDMRTSITLYDLNDDYSQEFKISYKDDNFIPVANALIQIQRKYISEGIFKTVEIPKTDVNGETIAHLKLSDAIYTFIVVKDGVVLGTFNNVVAYCDNVATGDCTINLNTFSSSITSEDFETSDDFSYNFDWDEDTSTITVVYSIPSGSVEQVELNTTLYDGLGNQSVCTDTLTSSSGTLNCVVPSGFGNSTVLSTLTKDNEFMGRAFVTINQDPSDVYGGSIMFLGFFLMITVIGLGISSSPIIMGFFLLLGGILSVFLNLSDDVGIFGAGATVLWLMISIAIIIIKGSNRQ